MSITAKDLALPRLTHHNEVRCREGIFWTEELAGKTHLVTLREAPLTLFPHHPLGGEVGYGGGAFGLDHETVYFVSQGRIFRSNRQTLAFPRPITPAFGASADPAPHPRKPWVAYVHSGDDGEDVLALVPADGSAWPRILAKGASFYMQPAWHPEGTHLAWIEWDLPNMPWDGTRLVLAEFHDGVIRNTQVLAGDEGTAVFQPCFSPDGRFLLWLENPSGEEGDRLVRLDLQSGRRAVLHEALSLIDPAWAQGMRVMAFGPSGFLYLRQNDRGQARLWKVDVERGQKTELPSGGYSWFSSLDGDEKRLVAIASAPDRPERVIAYDGQAFKVIAYGSPHLPGPFSPGEAVRFQSAGGDWVEAIYYPPISGHPRPPAVVSVHGGPTSQRTHAFNLQAQFFASQGFAYLELNYRGSTGYGRSYRQALYGQWGLVDVEDAVAAARFLAESGRADPTRLGIMGGSAGGYTVLMTLATHAGIYRAGVSMFGVTDLFLLAERTHKFESRYTDKLVGPLPNAAPAYRERSPLHHAHRIRDPLYVFQGGNDKVVVPEHAEALVRILRENGTPHRYKRYPDEGHGWRDPATIEDFYTETLVFFRSHLR